jgi:hypothetical protein
MARLTMHRGVERRGARRRISPLRALIDGHRYRVMDWSDTGFAVGGFDGEVRPGQVMVVTVAVPLSGPRGRVRLTATVARYDQDRRVLAFSFSDGDAAAVELFTRYAME